jgi:Kef-type K+ transport system membrane component KefB
MRKAITIVLVVAGFALMVVGLLSAAPWGTSSVADSNPVFPGAPALFVIGIMLIVSSAVVYEILPDRRRR